MLAPCTGDTVPHLHFLYPVQRTSSVRLSEPRVDHLNIPPLEVLSDSSHADFSRFAPVTVRIADEDRAEGLGYTTTVGNIDGTAVASLLRDSLHNVHEFQHYLSPGLVSFPKPDLAIQGGITPWIRTVTGFFPASPGTRSVRWR